MAIHAKPASARAAALRCIKKYVYLSICLEFVVLLLLQMHNTHVNANHEFM